MSSKVFKKDNPVSDVIQIVHQSRNFAYSAVNFSMVVAYWKIGERIVIEEQEGNVRAVYGQELLAKLANQLTKKLGKGYTENNLRYMRQFYLAFPIRHALRDESSSAKSSSPRKQTIICL